MEVGGEGARERESVRPDGREGRRKDEGGESGEKR